MGLLGPCEVFHCQQQMSVLMTDEFNSDDNPPVVTDAERIARLEQKVTDHIRWCERHKQATRWFISALIATATLLILILQHSHV